jgi:hypothetical protein
VGAYTYLGSIEILGTYVFSLLVVFLPPNPSEVGEKHQLRQIDFNYWQNSYRASNYRSLKIESPAINKP